MDSGRVGRHVWLFEPGAAAGVPASCACRPRQLQATCRHVQGGGGRRGRRGAAVVAGGAAGGGRRAARALLPHHRLAGVWRRHMRRPCRVDRARWPALGLLAMLRCGQPRQQSLQALGGINRARSLPPALPAPAAAGHRGHRALAGPRLPHALPAAAGHERCAGQPAGGLLPGGQRRGCAAWGRAASAPGRAGRRPGLLCWCQHAGCCRESERPLQTLAAQAGCSGARWATRRRCAGPTTAAWRSASFRWPRACRWPPCCSNACR